jgi:hypothetical protein
MSYESSFASLHTALASFSAQTIGAAELCRVWRSEQELLAALPMRYREAMEDLLGRVETGSLFSEESCSFSQEDLSTSLSSWLDLARQQLARQ